MTRTAVINQKGGVAKTTTTVNLGAALARRGKRVLLLDLDPQSNLTLHLDHRPEDGSKTVTSLFLDGAGLAGLIRETSTPGLFLLPADTSLAGVEQALANRIGRETLLREAFEEYRGDIEFDCVLVDCPPSLGVLSANALVACDQVLIPVQAEYLALQGMAKLTEVIELVQKRLNPSLKIACILPCMVDRRTNLAAEVLSEIRRHFGTLLAENMIRANVKLAEAPSFGRTVFQHAPDSNGADDYARFAEEFMARQARPSLQEPEPEVEQQELDAMEAITEAEVRPASAEPAPEEIEAIAEPEPVAAASASPETQETDVRPQVAEYPIVAVAQPQAPDSGPEPAPTDVQASPGPEAPPAGAEQGLAGSTG